jgi:predicted dehydrogenase
MIGCGRAALAHHLPALARVDEAEVVALADPSREALDAVGDKFGVARRSEDYRDLLTDESIDAVCVAAPSDLHTEMTLAALDAGKHALVEKPLALSIDDCDLLVGRAAESGLKTMVGFNMRWHQHSRRARELVRQGQLGDVRLLRSVFASPSLVTPGIPRWRLDPARGGGMFAMQSVHHLDLWRFLLDDEIEEVFCGASGQPEAPGPGTAAIVASTSGGVRIAGDVCGVTGQQSEFAIYGSKAWLGASMNRFDSFELVPQYETVGDVAYRVRGLGRFLAGLPRAASSIRRGGDFKASFQGEWHHFAGAIRHDEEVECGFEDGREVTRIMLAVLESAQTGRPVRVADAQRSIEAVEAAPAGA